MRRRRQGRTVWTALMLGVALALPSTAAPAVAAETPEDTEESHTADGADPDGFSFSGDDVSGGSTPGDAAELAVDGRYLDALIEGTLHYRIPREHADSSLHVGLLTRYSPDADEDADLIRAGLSTWDGASCGSTSFSPSATTTAGSISSAHLVTEPGESSESCKEAEELVLTVELQPGAQNSQSQSAGRPLEIVVFDEPLPENLDDLPAAEPEAPEWTDIGRDTADAETISGGASFADATALSPAQTYRVTLSPGQTRVFRVPLDWGQRLQAEAYISEPTEEDYDAWQALERVHLAVLDPLYGRLDSRAGYLSTSFPTDTQVSTAEVQWNQREETTPSGSSVAGEHYLVLSLPAAADHEDLEVETLLTLDTFGEAGEGAPQYPDDEEPAVPEQPGAEAGPGSNRVGEFTQHPAVIALIGTLGAVLVVTGGVLFFLARRRPNP